MEEPSKPVPDDDAPWAKGKGPPFSFFPQSFRSQGLLFIRNEAYTTTWSVRPDSKKINHPLPYFNGKGGIALSQPPLHKIDTYPFA